MNRKIFIFLVLLCVNCFGWGGGHEFITEILIDKLPEEIKLNISQEIKEKMIKIWSHYPDSFEPFTEGVISDTSFQILKKYGISKRYDLHSSKGKAVNFILIVESLKGKRYNEACLWISSICHTISDEGALNHGPLIHYITYGFTPMRIKMGKGIGLDIIEISKTGGKEMILKLLENYEPKIISETPEEAIINILMKEVISNSFMTQRERKIMRSFKIEATQQEIEEAKNAMVEIGANNVKDTLEIIYTAYFYSKNGIEVKFNEDLIKEFEKRKREYLEKRKIEDDSIYEGVLIKEKKYPAIGVIIEPSQTMHHGIFPFGSKYVLSAIMWYLKQENISYEPIDIREIINKKISISPEKIPVLILYSGNLLPLELKNLLKEYLEKGGVLFLIGGMTKLTPYKEILGECYDYFKEMSEDIIPVSPKYGYENLEIVKKLKFYFLNDLKETFGESDYKIVRNPNTPAGWQKPVCIAYIEENKNFTPLIKISNGEKECFVSGILSLEKGKIIFIPSYFLSPFIFSEEDTLKDPSTPYLDTTGKKILNFLLKKILKNGN